MSWEARAAGEPASTLAKIPSEWKVSGEDTARAKKQRDLTGPFIQQFLGADDISVISKDSVEIVESVKGGSLSAVQVTTAFCKAAAIAHQIVSSNRIYLSSIWSF